MRKLSTSRTETGIGSVLFVEDDFGRNRRSRYRPRSESAFPTRFDRSGIIAPGELIGRYEVVRLLDSGGQANVYRARDPRLRRDLIIKRGHAAVESGSAGFSRILTEGALLAGLQHPHLPRVYDVGVDRGAPYFVMEFVEGRNLRDSARAHVLSCRQIRRWMEQLASAVECVHQVGMLHLDLKPQNVIVTVESDCKLIDFGMSSRLGSGTSDALSFVAGTSDFMAPEQRSGNLRDWSEATDVFGLGGILYFLLTGSSPFPHSGPLDALSADDYRRIDRHLASVQVPADLAGACRRALRENPRERFQQAESFRRALTFRKRLGDRILGSLCLLMGLVMLLVGLLLFVSKDTQPESLNHEPDGSHSSATLPGMAIQLSIQSAGSQPPYVYLFTSTRGWCEVQGLKLAREETGDLWRPHSFDGRICSGNPDRVVCLLASRHSVPLTKLNTLWPSMKRIRNSQGIPIESRRLKSGLTRRFSHRQMADRSDLPPGVNVRLRSLQQELDELKDPYQGWLAIRPEHEGGIWEMAAELALPLQE